MSVPIGVLFSFTRSIVHICRPRLLVTCFIRLFYRWFGIIGPTTFKRLCEEAGIEGYKTNHSLRVTTATRLFQSGAEEQLIMATGLQMVLVLTSALVQSRLSSYQRRWIESRFLLTEWNESFYLSTYAARAYANHMGTPRQSLAYETTVELL